MFLVLRDKTSAASVERELELLRQLQEAQTTRIFRRARALRILGAIMAFVTLLLLCAALWVIIRRL